MQRAAESAQAEAERTTVSVRCTGHVRSAVGTAAMAFGFEGETLRSFLEAFFDEHDVREMILAGSESDATAPGWTPATTDRPGTWRKNPEGDQTRRYARVTVNGVFNEHLDGLDTRLEAGDRVALMYPFVFCV
jgi:molybdopterin converting factor small subunit